MIILDENIEVELRDALRKRRLHPRHIGFDLHRAGIGDDSIPALLRTLTKPTFFTLDLQFYNRKLRNRRYAIVLFWADADELADLMQDFLRHPDFRNWALRAGIVAWVTRDTIQVWRLRSERVDVLHWRGPS